VKRGIATYWSALAILAAVHVTLIWALDVMPGQDFPQHLAYVRILVDLGDADLPYRDLYQVAAEPQPYFVTYSVLAGLATVVGVLDAFRIVLSIYVIATLLAFHVLVVAAHRKTPPWTGLLGVTLVWSPVACMGFVSFMLAIPLMLAGTAALLFHLGDRSRRAPLVAVGACSAALVSLHAVAAGSLLFVALVIVAFVRAPRPWRAFAVVSATMLVTQLAWSLAGTTGLGSWSRMPDVGETIRASHGLEFVDKLLGIEWSSPMTKLSYVAWTVLGPYRWTGLLLVAVLALALAGIARRARHGVTPDAPPAMAPIHRRLVIALGVLALVIPWGLYVPSEITFLNLRVMTIAFAIALALVRPAWFEPLRARAALLGFCGVFVAHFAVRAVGFDREADVALRIEARAIPRGVMLSLPFHDRSDHFAKQFRLTHFLPMYYTVQQRGVNTQFWARYTDHLPVGYRPGKHLRAPVDWRPWEFGPADLEDADYVLVQLADDADPATMRDGSSSADAALRRVATSVECNGRWCLYRLP
jgi:hypothetical protein